MGRRVPSQIAAVKALEAPVYYRNRWRETHRLREIFARELGERAGLGVVPGVANFLLCHLSPAHPETSTVVRECRQRGLYLRDAALMGGSLGPRALRIAVRDAQANERMLEILREVLTPRRR